MLSSVLSGMKHLHNHIVHRDLEYVAPPFVIRLPIFGETFVSNTWLVNRPENILFCTKVPSSNIVIASWRVRPLDFLAGNMSHMCVIRSCSFKQLDSSEKLHTPIARSLGNVTPEVRNQQGIASLSIFGQ